ncbi:Exoribonuclease 2 [Synechococcus sp. MIT S9509]|uniref:ribonuclease catalytic domain-containing protein n=1 Tax=unclassified Synechococcus TaxID=2626047 RepID=UPI0007BB2BE3|nr:MULTISPECIES: ribonuclease catalytic domain-containing protein [unclassified Synechococcus]KZR88032.1 Exoribonuclease 2 [Synechococcus sp. MIT S9504]KZR92183.1 Exoribonuclease 2 [Synechococcus sp. MIT S9509]
MIHPLPGDVDPSARLGAFPWTFSQQDLDQSSPSCRDWGEAWVLILESGETVDLAGFAELACGIDAAVNKAACWLALHADQDFFRWKQGAVQARPASEIRNRRAERRVQAKAERRSKQWLQLLKAPQPLVLDTLDCVHQQWIKSLQQLVGEGAEAIQLDAQLLQSLQTARIEANPRELRHLLIQLGQWDEHQLASIAGTPWSDGFSEHLLLEARQLVENSDAQLPGDENRLDLTAQVCVTIDDVETSDIDDAIALERRRDGSERLWIHIADPGRLIPEGSPLDLEARRRGSSLYLSRGNLPMFPAELSTGPFSLRTGRRNAAWSTWVDLDQNGEISDFGILRSWVTPRYRLTYDDADELIDFAPPEEADLADLHKLLERRRRWRTNQGALQMDLPEGRIRCRDGELSVQVTEPGASRTMVAEAMILAGAVAARFGSTHNLALPYRSQLPAELPSATELEQLPDGAVRFAAIKRCLSRGLMGTQPSAHFSLGLNAYAQATSPIRRYGDLVVQRQIAAVINAESPLSEELMQDLINSFDSAVREGLTISREDQRHWQQVWFERHQSHQWPVDFLRWLRPQDRLGLVRLDELAMDVAAECPAGSLPGDALLLRVDQVDSQCDQLRLLAMAR